MSPHLPAGVPSRVAALCGEGLRRAPWSLLWPRLFLWTGGFSLRLLPSLAALVFALLFFQSLLPEEDTSWSHMGWGGVCVSVLPPFFLFLSFWFSVLEHTLSHKVEKCPVPQENSSSPQGFVPALPIAKSVFPCDIKIQQSPVCPVSQCSEKVGVTPGGSGSYL